MDHFTLSCFLHLVATKSFTKAAAKVGRTQSALTQQIRKLEKEVKKPLFHRGKIISLTKDGEIFFAYAQKISHQYQEMMDRFAQPELQGEISIGLPEDFATLFLSDILIDFSKIHPRISLRGECDLTLNLMEKFKREELDMVLVKMSRPEDFPFGVEVWSEPLQWVSSHGYFPLLNEKSSLPLVLSPEPCVFREIALDALNRKNIPWRITFTSPSYVGTTAAVEAGMGVTLLPKTMIPKNLQSIEEKTLPPLPEIHVSLLHQSKIDAATETLRTFLLQKLGRRYH